MSSQQLTPSHQDFSYKRKRIKCKNVTAPDSMITFKTVVYLPLGLKLFFGYVSSSQRSPGSLDTVDSVALNAHCIARRFSQKRTLREEKLNCLFSMQHVVVF